MLRHDKTSLRSGLLRRRFDAFALLAAWACLLAPLGCSTVEEKVASQLQKIQDEPSSADDRIATIAALGAPAAPKLIEALNNAPLRVHAVQALAKIGAPAVPALAEALDKTSDPATIRNIANALRQIGPEASAAVPALARALDNPGEQALEGAASALGAIGSAAAPAAPKLAELLANGNVGVLVRQAGARGLGGILSGGAGSPPAPEEEKCAMALAQALNHDSNEQVRLEAANSLGRIGAKAKPALPAIHQAVSTHSEPETRAEAARILGSLKAGDGKSLDVLFKAMSDPHFGVRNNAVWSLGEVGAPAKPAIPGMRKLAGMDPGLGQTIMEAIQKIEADAGANGK